MSDQDVEGATQRMAHADARQWQRFGYPADIQLRYEPIDARKEQERVLAAVSFDLSLGGMQLRAAAGLALGTRVTCRLPDAHGGLNVPGRVRWTRPDESRGSQLRFRMGVQFEPLRASMLQNLQAVVSQVERAGEMVKVHVPSASEPLCAVREPSDQGVRLRLPLPFWSDGSIVRFEPLQAAEVLEGRVISTQLRAAPGGNQGVELELVLSPCQPARKRRYLMYDDAAPAASETDGARGRPRKREREREATEVAVLAVPKTRVNGLLMQLSIVTGLFWLGFGVMQYASPARLPELRSPLEAAAPAQTETSLQAASTGPTEGATAPKPDEEPKRVEVPAVPVQAQQPDSAREPDVASSEPPPQPQASDEPAPQSAPPQETEAPRETDETDNPAHADTPTFVAPMLSSTNDTTEIFVPVRGPVTGMTSALWVDPSAVVVDLPAGQLELSQARYDLNAGGVSVLRVGRNRGVTQLRVYLTALLSQFDAVPARGGIVIRLRRDLQSLPH